MKFVQVFLFVLALCTVSGAVALMKEDDHSSWCGFGRMNTSFGTVPHQRHATGETTHVLRSLAKSSGFQPLRIGFFYDTILNPNKTCHEEGATITNAGGVSATCAANDVVTEARLNRLINDIAPFAVKRHEERLNVRRVNSPIVIPQSMNYYCDQIDIPESHRTEGVSGYDVIMYLQASTSQGSVASTSLCDVEDDEGRPLVFMVNMNPGTLDEPEWPYRGLAHEMMHGLGFAGHVAEKKGMLAKRTVRGKADTNVMLAGPNLKREIENQFDCANRDYIEISDDLSHWKARNMVGDLLGPNGRWGYYSALLIAAMEDTGLFTGNYDRAETLPWGLGAGCAFLDEHCVTDSVALPKTKFCTVKESVYGCDGERNSLTICPTASLTTTPDWASDYGQWSDDASLDYCPVYGAGTSGYGCIASGDNALDSVGGSDSLCLDASRDTAGGVTTDGVCAIVRCNADSYDVQLKGRDWQACSEGSTFTIQSETGRTRTITCPPMYEVCRVERGVPSTLDPSTLDPSTIHPQLGSRVGSVSVSLIVALCVAVVSAWWM